ncbi:MAG: SDR family oxidoreductase [Pseudomonadota bacterium]
MARNRSSIVITGVSTGIGRAIAEKFAKKGWTVFGSVRKEADAAELQSALGDNFRPLIFDVTKPDAINQAANEVREALQGRTLNGLVNNAGVALGGPLLYIDPEIVRRQFEINIFGPLFVTQAFGPLLGADRSLEGKPGRIVNMSSVAGKIASPILAPYAMSKHALEAFSESLRRELLVHGIDVIVVGPGAIKTPIWAKADEIDAEDYKGTEYYDILVGMRTKFQEVGEEGLPPEDIGALVWKIMSAGKPKVRYAILRNKLLMWTLPRLLPKRMLDKVLADRFDIPVRK